MKTRRGFTLVELMIVVTIVGLLAAVAIPGYIKYVRRSKTTEALMNLRRLFDATIAYVNSEHGVANGAILARQFPDTQAPSPAFGVCCAQVGMKCAPSPAYWATPVFVALHFGEEDPFYYSYYTSRAIGIGSAVGDKYVLGSSGDLDCDNNRSFMERFIFISAEYHPVGASAITVNPDE